MQRQVYQRDPEKHNRQPGGQRQAQRLHQRARQPLRIPGAKRLRRQPGGAHTQKKEQHKEEAGRRCANRHAAQINRTVEMTNNGGIHQPQQRNGDIGEDHGQR